VSSSWSGDDPLEAAVVVAMGIVFLIWVCAMASLR
jgi:hypothetical protein